MYTCALSTATLDTYGPVELLPLPKSDFGTVERRAAISDTTDGECVHEDYGYAECDREMRLYWRYDDQVDQRVAYLVRSYSTLRLYCRDGSFEVAGLSYLRGAKESLLRLRVLSRLDETD